MALRLFPAFVLAAILIACTTAVDAQQPDRRIRGSVRDARLPDRGIPDSFRAPGDQSREGMFPEDARAVPLSSLPIAAPDWPANARYDFGSCQVVADAVTPDTVRLYGRDLDQFRDLLFPDPPHFSCTPDDCFLRMNTAHVGRTVTITESGILCDDPTVPGTARCDIGINSPNRGINSLYSYRGNTIIADRIRVSGRIRLGYLALVLVAREEIEFLAGSEILGAQMLVPEQADFGASGYVIVTPQTVQTCLSIDPRTGQRVEGNYSMRRYYRFDVGDTGEPSADKLAPALVMIAPRIRGTGSILLHGYPGGKGTNGANPECQVDDTICLQSLRQFRPPQPGGANGAQGGSGGPGGRVIIRSGSALPSTITVSVSGGAGGPGGDPGYLQRFSGCAPRIPQRVEAYGVAGPPGPAGPAGRVDAGALGNDLAAYAYLFGRRGADRHRNNALHYSRDVFDTASAARATSFFNIVNRNYCEVAPLQIARPGVPPAGATLFSAAARSRQERFCAEVKTRQRWVREGINYFGLPREFYMYVRPDILYDFRQHALATVDELSNTFQDTIRHENRLVDAQLLQQQADALVSDKARAADIAALRRDLLMQKVVVTMDRMKRNNDSLDLMERDMNRLRWELEPMLEPRDCDFFCLLGQLLQFVAAIADIASGISSVVDQMSGFIEGLAQFDFATIVRDVKDMDSLYPRPDPPTSPLVNTVKAVAIWSDLMIGGVDNLQGLGDVGSAAIDVGKKVGVAKDKLEPLSNSLSGPPKTPLEMLAKVWTGNKRAERQLLDSLESINNALGRLENDAVPVVDRLGAIGKLRQMRDLVLQRLELSRDSQRLVEENMLASLEFRIGQEEAVLARQELEHARDTARRLGCRTGAVTGSACAGIFPLATANQLRDVRDDVCRIARQANDTALLFDYFYNRARDFVDLSDRAANGERPAIASHDFRRNFLKASDRQSLRQVTVDALQEDFLDVLQPLAHGRHTDGFCRPGAACTFQSHADATTNERVIRDLLDDGRVQFEVGTPELEQEGQRVTRFDLRLHAPAPYRLGCDDLNPCPPATPPDQPFSRSYEFDFAHDPLATFEDGSGDLRHYYFSSAYPTAACEVIQSRLGSALGRWDCRQISAFTGSGSHDNVTSFPDSYEVTRQNYTDDPAIFGTSIRGLWTVDIRRTLATMNADDNCYPTATGTLPSRCLPAQCLSPCFDAAGNRLPAGAATPAYCGCYDAAGNLADTTSPGCPASLPAQLAFVLPDAELPAGCRADAAGLREYQRACANYIDSGQLQRHGDQQCCTEAGFLKPGLTAAQQQTCSNRGLGSDTACRTPDLCYELCGPRCKAFKNALVGFEYRIFWKAR